MTEEPAVTRVLVADDDALVRSGVRMLLAAAPDMDVVGEAADGDAAVDLARSLAPDVVLMDLRMPGTDGVEATRRLTSDDLGVAPDAPVRVLVLTTFDDETSVRSALLAGASGFLVKDSAPDHLAEAVRAVAGGGSWLDPAAAATVIRLLQRTTVPGAPEAVDAVLGRLTAREREVLVLMAEGLSNQDIGERFVLSPATVRTHVSRILMKTGARDRAQAVALAYQGRLVTVPPEGGRHGTPQ